MKRKFGESIRSKSDVAMRNEVYAKMVCQNVCCLISAMYELGLTPPTWRDEPEPETAILPFVRRDTLSIN